MEKAIKIINREIRLLKKYRMQEGLEMAIIKYDWGIGILENIKARIEG